MPPFERAPQSGKGDGMEDLFRNQIEYTSTLPPEVFQALETEVAPLVKDLTEIDARTHNKLYQQALHIEGIKVTLEQLNTYLKEKGVSYPTKERFIGGLNPGANVEPPSDWDIESGKIVRESQRGGIPQQPGWQYEGKERPLIPDPNNPGGFIFADEQ
jgi:hypothetical protein